MIMLSMRVITFNLNWGGWRASVAQLVASRTAVREDAGSTPPNAQNFCEQKSVGIEKRRLAYGRLTQHFFFVQPYHFLSNSVDYLTGQ